MIKIPDNFALQILGYFCDSTLESFYFTLSLGSQTLLCPCIDEESETQRLK